MKKCCCGSFSDSPVAGQTILKGLNESTDLQRITEDNVLPQYLHHSVSGYTLNRMQETKIPCMRLGVQA